MATKRKETETSGQVARRNLFYDTTRFGQPQIRVYHRAGKGRKMPRYLLKCGCCPSKLKIYYDRNGLEIGRVNGAIEDWREILMPLLSPARNKPKSTRRRKP